jgi:hypothetical protein
VLLLLPRFGLGNADTRHGHPGGSPAWRSTFDAGGIGALPMPQHTKRPPPGFTRGQTRAAD